jgi:hypothetical protein
MTSQSLIVSPCRGLRVYTHIEECEKQLIVELRKEFPTVYVSQTDMDILVDYRSLPILAEENSHPKVQGFGSVMDLLRSSVHSWLGENKYLIDGLNAGLARLVSDESIEMVVNVFETLPLVLTMLSQATSISGVITILLAGLKMLSKRPLIYAAFDHIETVQKWIKRIWSSDVEVQSGGTTWAACEDILKCARGWFDGTEDFLKSKCFSRFEKLFKYFLSFGIFTHLGLDFDDFNYDRLEKQKIKRDCSSKAGFIFTLCNSVVWILERSMQALKLGSFSPFYHSSESYSKWASEAYMLLEDEHKLSNEEATGIDYNDFIFRLDSTITDGNAMTQYALEKSEKIALATLMSKLRLLRTRRCVEDASQMTRKAPDSILVFGSSSVAKSKFGEILFKYYGSLFDLDTCSNKMYTRCFTDEYWTNFKTFKWCIWMDDVAMFNPQMGQLDPSLAEVIQIVNNVPYTPPQAALEDKGQNPLRPRLVIGSTNVQNLNASAYFTCPLAVQRRFKYIVELEVKDEYCLVQNYQATTMIDPHKIPPSVPGQFPDLWNITVKQVFAENGGHGKVSNPRIDEVAVFTDINKFLAFWGTLLIESAQCSAKEQKSTTDMDSVSVCKVCYQVGSSCTCLQVQAGLTPLEVFKEKGCMTLKEAYEVFYADQASIVYTQELSDRELHDQHPELWVRMIMHRLRQGEWVTQSEIDESNAKIGLQLSAEELALQVQRGEFADPEIYNFADVFSDFVEDIGFDRTCDAYLTAKQFFLEPQLAYRIVNGTVESATTFLRFVRNEVMLSSIKVYLAVDGFFSMIVSNVKQTFSCGLDCVGEVTRQTEVMINTIARLMAKGIKITWHKATEPLVAYATYRIGLYCLKKLKEQFKVFGARVAKSLNCPKLWIFLGVIAAAYPIYRGVSYLLSPTLQGAASSIPKDEKANAWEAQDPFRMCEMDVGTKTVGSQSQGHAETLKQIAKNVVCIECQRPGMKTTWGRAICLIGHVYMTANHILTDEVQTMSVIDSDCGSQELMSKMIFTVDQSSIKRWPEQDLCFFECNLPPKRDITGFFPAHSLSGGTYKGSLVKRDRLGVLEFVSATKITLKDKRVPLPSGERNIRSWEYWPGSATFDGDCGSALVAETSKGTVIFGLHQTYHALLGSSVIAVTREIIESALKGFTFQVQGSDPDLCGKELHELHWKSVMRSIPGHAKVFGSFGRQEFRAAPKSCVVKTLLCDAAVEEGFVIEHTQPHMKGPEPWLIAATPCAQITGRMDHKILNECADAYTDDCWEAIKDTHFVSEMAPLSVVEAVNGLPGVRFIDKMNRNTSMGFPFKKSKRYFLKNLDDGNNPDMMYTDGVQFTAEIEAEVERVHACYREGKRYSPIFNGCLKDEPVTFKKALMKKTRVFMSGPAAWSIVVRQMLLPFVRVFQSNPFAFEGAVGINPNSHQWEELRTYLTHFGLETNVAGDYGNYDKRMYAYLIRLSFKIIADIMSRCGCSREHVIAILCIGEDVAFAWLDFQGDLVQFFGGNPSGHPLTVIINCIVNSLYMRYCYHVLNEDAECITFKQFVHLITYGDDNAQNVSPLKSWFNHTAIKDVLASIDVVYTMADKDAPSRPFIHIDEVSFLKRKWVLEPTSGIWLAPLEWSSLNKALTMGTKSSSECAEAQAAQTVRNVALEMFHHGPVAFEDGVARLRRIVQKSGLENWVARDAIKTWDEYVDMHQKCSLGFGSVSPIACESA